MGESRGETREVCGSLFNSVSPNESHAAGHTDTFGSNASLASVGSK